MAQSKFFTGKLYDRMADDLHLGGMSERTHAGYLAPFASSPITVRRLRARSPKTNSDATFYTSRTKRSSPMGRFALPSPGSSSSTPGPASDPGTPWPR